MAEAPRPGLRQLIPFAVLSATYFAHIGFFNPYLPLWLKDQGLPIVTISLLASVQSLTADIFDETGLAGSRDAFAQAFTSLARET